MFLRDSFTVKLAKLLVDYCIDLGSGEEVGVQFNYEALPLVTELYRFIVSRGSYPIPLLEEELLSEAFFKHATEDALKHVSPVEEFMFKHVNALIKIVSYTHTKYLSSINPSKVSEFYSVRKRLSEIFLKRSAEGDLKWVVTLYPTKALAQEAGMSYYEYRDFVFKACKLYLKEPVSEWVKIGERQSRIIDELRKICELRFYGEKLDLTVRVDGRRWISDDGKKNMPGGEIFTSPIEDGVDGTVEFTYPAIWRGIEVEGIRLRFKRGVVVEAKALKGEGFLKKIIKTDDGSCRVGEVAFGLNYDINKFTKVILFDEKIGGTIHLALGSAYPETGGKNVSGIHWDMIRDMRNCRVYGDGDLIYENGELLI